MWHYNIYFFHSTYGLFPLNKNCPYCGLYLTVTLICCQNKGGTTGISGRSNQACSKEFWPGFQHVSTIPPSPMHPPNPVNLGAIEFSLGLLRKTSHQKNATDRYLHLARERGTDRRHHCPIIPPFLLFFDLVSCHHYQYQHQLWSDEKRLENVPIQRNIYLSMLGVMNSLP